MAKVVPIGKPENAGESRTFQYLQAALPDSTLVLSNVAVPDSRGNRDVDALVLCISGVHVVEIKDWSGKIVGRETGDWKQDDASLLNPCFQTTKNREIFRNFMFRNARKIFDDPRASYGVPTDAILALVSDKADTNGIKIERLEHFHVCKNLMEIKTVVARQRNRTRQFLANAEIHRIAELLGARKNDLDDWESVLVPKHCGKCQKENRPSAKFCIQCGNKL